MTGLRVVAEETWLAHAACVGQPAGIMFPRKGDMVAWAKAKALCAACPVHEPCLEYALDNGEKYGCWGGLSERERRRLRWARKKTEWTHGTVYAYQYHGCRCDQCRAAKSKEKAKYRAARLTGPGPWCGTLSGYQYHRCRCSACCEAKAENRRQYNARRGVA